MRIDSTNENRSTHHRPRLVMLLSSLLLSAVAAFAHPMGNFSVNHYSKIKIGQKSIEVRYLIDMAEIPTFQEMRQFDIAPKTDDPSASQVSRATRATLEARTLFRERRTSCPVRHDISPRQVQRRRRGLAHNETRVRISGHTRCSR
jgi:hypothetical protein